MLRWWSIPPAPGWAPIRRWISIWRCCPKTPRFDIVYNPLETKLLKDASARGHKTIDGLGMLMHQAAPSFEAFFGVRPEVTPALRAVLVKVLSERPK